MNAIIRVLPLFIALLACGGPTGAQDQKGIPPELQKLRAQYQSKIAEIDVGIRKEKIEPLLEKYDGALNRLEDAEAKAGNLDGLLVIRKERERAGAEGGIAEKDVVKEPAAVSAMQTRLLDGLTSIERERERQIDAMRAIFLQSAEQLKTDLTKQKRVDDALAVVAAIGKIEKEQGAGPEPIGHDSQPNFDQEKPDITG
ncbi:MAG: hypothetical protein HKN23_11230, partial [Verrucomicrobiales bacterium]|nr:hypothetical protein [Verrucomicrobiales bacterium]